MAEPVSVALKKVADQLECSVCLQSLTDPKQLQCFHVCCKACLEPLVLRDQHGLSLCCPNCRHSTLLPANGVSGLRPAFHVHHLFEIQDALQKVKQGQEGQKTLCEKCQKKEANGFCRDCGKFVCEACIEIHKTWEEYTSHKLISLEQLKSDATEIVTPTKKTLYCSKHPGKELDLFCESDQELICQHCIVSAHRDHQYDLVTMVFPKHRDAIAIQLEPVRQQLNTVNKAIQDLGTARDQIMDQQAAIEADIRRKIEQLHEALEDRKTVLIGQLEEITAQKLKALSIQQDELELIQARLNSCLQFVNDSLRTSSEGEILVMEKPVVHRVADLTTEYDPDKLMPQEQADIVHMAGTQLLPACQKYGQVYTSQVCPRKCYATGKAHKVATIGEQSTVTVHAIDTQDYTYTKPLLNATISCTLVTEQTVQKCSVKTEANKFEVHYRPTCRGMHQLYLKVSDKHIKGSPFTVVSRGRLDAPVRTITGLRKPWGVAINEKGQAVVSERDDNSISIYSPSGEKIKSIRQKGFNFLHGVAVDRADNIFAVSGGSSHIQKFTVDGLLTASVASRENQCQLGDLVGIGINPRDKVYVCDRHNHRIQILNPDLTLSASFGSKGSGDGQFLCPWDVAFDSRGDVYVTDCENHRIQVFTEDGCFLRTFRKEDDGYGELKFPGSIAIDLDDMVYVSEMKKHCIFLFTGEGHFLRSFGTPGKGPGQFNQPHGIAIDKDGYVYICDYGNNRVQVW